MIKEALAPIEVTNEFIKSLYPACEGDDGIVFYDPSKNILCKDDSVFFYNKNQKKFGKGAVTEVWITGASKTPIYTVNNNLNLAHWMVWPDPDGQERLE